MTLPKDVKLMLGKCPYLQSNYILEDGMVWADQGVGVWEISRSYYHQTSYINRKVGQWVDACIAELLVPKDYHKEITDMRIVMMVVSRASTIQEVQEAMK